jgi:hypothetical protein
MEARSRRGTGQPAALASPKRRGGLELPIPPLFSGQSCRRCWPNQERISRAGLPPLPTAARSEPTAAARRGVLFWCRASAWHSSLPPPLPALPRLRATPAAWPPPSDSGTHKRLRALPLLSHTPTSSRSRPTPAAMPYNCQPPPQRRVRPFQRGSEETLWPLSSGALWHQCAPCLSLIFPGAPLLSGAAPPMLLQSPEYSNPAVKPLC